MAKNTNTCPHTVRVLAPEGKIPPVLCRDCGISLGTKTRDEDGRLRGTAGEVRPVPVLKEHDRQPSPQSANN